ncbi:MULTISPECIES: EAL domain-containing protein [unclassified Uliginosibacterium]|uniref:EAL domain-containing response regulator n=1 Tax=unclassified Uliginosibacterium TaxID=2621521 RepID=UPI000C797E95|nr:MULTISPECIES: EAL domain-containing response regulator [unclassified Uliginosibacterium]MDO6384787.1 EAL domain-containing response regulator [Uliginosibacterium sp. 31-12]PLK48476.1 hypothetical protein C0V76_10410 [Uliginosibacterium sp. TH139]
MRNGLPRPIKLYGALVVDDSSVQRMNAVDMLQSAGVPRVLEAADGRAGLDLIRNQTPPPAFLIVDLEMPGMDGIEMLQALANENYRPPFLIVSGQQPNLLSSIETMCQELGLPILGAFSKPLTRIQLQQGLEGFSRMVEIREHPAIDAGLKVSPEVLADALARQEILPHFQPKLNLVSGKLEGFESLARWTSPHFGPIPPVAFIPVAEAHGLIDDLTRAMFDAVLTRMQQWQAEGFHPHVAVNLSTRSLADRYFCDDLIRRTQSAGIPPDRLILEITESSLMSDLGAGLGALGRLRLKGFRLSMDDYGTGFSTAQQLSRLPLTELKIDRSFVADAPGKPSLRTILASMISMSLDLGLSTLAEGVETVEQLRLLQSLSCQQVQGFLLGRPMPGEAVLPWWQAEEARIVALITGE